MSQLLPKFIFLPRKRYPSFTAIQPAHSNHKNQNQENNNDTMDQFRSLNTSAEMKDHSSEQRPPPTIRDSSTSAFSKPLLPSTSSLLPPKLHFAPPRLNGSIKFSSASDSPIPPTPSPYKECLRNHAANVGGYVIDGCCEFMPAGFADPFKCMACGCHRSFHRKQPEPESKPFNPSPKPVLYAAANASEHRSSSEEKADRETKERSRKRFRTKFSEEQKERMKAFAERAGWRVNKKDEGELDRFCKEVGISRQVLRVWMHNNKNLFNNGGAKHDVSFVGMMGVKVERGSAASTARLMYRL